MTIPSSLAIGSILAILVIMTYGRFVAKEIESLVRGITVVNEKSAEELATLLDSGDAMADAIHIMADAIHIKAENINRGLNRWNELTENKNVTVKKG